MLVMLENHAFDNYFGTYCPTTSSVCSTNVSGIPNGTCVPKSTTNSSLGCVTPYPFPSVTSVTTDPAHTWTSSHKAYDQGAMDGFYGAENQNLQAFGYYNQSTVPFYWDLAEEYGLGENWFSSALSYSLPEHWWMMASAAPKISETSGVAGKLGQLSSAQVKYLNTANRTTSIDDVLVNSTVSWKYYDFPLPSSYGAALDTQAGGECHGGDGAFNYWNPLAAKAETYGTSFASHFVNRSQIFGDLNHSRLPEVSWVIPDCAHSDHPPESPSGGQEWVASLVNTLEASPEWNTTAMFITWDEYGGFYDHVAPRQINADGLGFRVPVIVVSPYARENFVSHRFEYFQSFLHLVEWRFGLNVTKGLGAGAPLPLEYFNFKAPPRAPMNFTTWPNATYPIALQAAPVPAPLSVRTSALGPTGVELSWGSSPGGLSLDGVRVDVRSPEGGAAIHAQLDGSVVGLELSGLRPLTAYTIHLEAVGAGDRESSAVVNVVTPSALPPPGSPDPLGAAAGSVFARTAGEEPDSGEP